MRHSIKVVAFVLMVVFTVSVVPLNVLAEESTEPNTGSETTTQAQDKEAAREALQKRLETRKAELKTRLTAFRKSRLEARCKASQGRISSISGRVRALETSRSQVYANIVKRLNNLVTLLQEKSIDTTGLEAQITELEGLIAVFNEKLASYKSAVSDLAEMDCEADPEAFQGSLEAAREARAETAESALAIRKYLRETIKPTLQSLKEQLENQPAEGSES